MSAGCVGEGIGPRVYGDLNEAFCLAAGPGRIGPGTQVPQAARHALPALRGGALGRAVVRQYRLHRAPLGAEPRQRPLQEGEGVAGPVWTWPATLLPT